MPFFSDMLERWALKKAYKWGKGRAKIKLFAFYTLQDAHPELSIDDLYYLTVLASRGFDEHRTRQLIKSAKEQAEGYLSLPGDSDLKTSVPVEPFSLRSVVKIMLSHEEWQLFRGKGFPYPDCIFEAWKAVDDIIPENL